MTHRSLIAHLHHASLSNGMQIFSTAAVLLRTAESMLLIVLPLFLYRLAGSIPGLAELPISEFQRGILAAVLYLMLPRILSLLAFPWLLKSLKVLHLGRSMTLGLILYALLTGGILLLPHYPSVFFVLPFIRFLGLFWFWLPYHLFLATETHLNKVGQQLGTLEFFVRLAGLLAPLLGALLSTHFGFTTTFLASISLMLVAAILTLFLPAVSTKQSWSWKEFFQLWNQPMERMNFAAIGGFIWESVGISFFWPIFLALQYASMTAAGYFLAIAGFLSLIFTYLSGWVYDHRKKPTLFARILGSCLSLLWIPRLLWSHQPLAIVAADASDNIVGGMYTTIFFSSIIRQARKNQIFTFYANYEVMVSLTITLGSLAVLLLLFTGWSWSALFLSFLSAGLLSLTFRFSKRE